MSQPNDFWSVLEDYLPKNNMNGILYYDETNNFRHLHLTEDGLNNPIDGLSFFLGGIGTIAPKTVDCTNLLNDLSSLDIKNVKKLKFRHFSYKKTNFLDILKSQRLNKLFQWIKEDENLFIHFSSVNYLFWILIDIVDESLKDYDVPMPHMELKSSLYDAITPNLGTFIDQLYEFGFPNIKNEDMCAFIEILLAYIEERQFGNLSETDDFYTEFLRQIIKTMRKSKDIIFLQNNEEHTLFDTYAQIYEKEIATFTKSQLIFDREPSIEPKIFNQVGKRNNFIFKESSDEILLQLSDAIVGFISKMSSYAELHSVEEILRDIKIMNSQQIENLRLWFDIERKSVELCPYLLCHIQPLSIRQKIGYLQENI
jgi:hypothetical protein